MISMKLEGGLGNQLFQIQAALLLAKNSSNLFFDISNVKKTHDRVGFNGFRLSKNDIKKKFSEKSYEVSINYFKNRKRFLKVINQKQYLNVSDFNESFPSNLILNNDNSNLNLIGYFQSYILCDEFRKSIFDFSQVDLKKESKYYEELVNAIKEEDPVVLHIRRGDYLQSAETIGVLSQQYYLDCLEEMKISKHEKVFIYSDSIENIEHEFFKLRTNYNLYFIPNTLKVPASHLLKAISHANRHIISNSTFSWWAAYLSKSSAVLAPNKFYRNTFNNKERNPPNWQEMEPIWI